MRTWTKAAALPTVALLLLPINCAAETEFSSQAPPSDAFTPARFVSLLASNIPCVPYDTVPSEALENPASSFGLQGVVNLRIPVGESGQSLGAWLLSPISEGNYLSNLTAAGDAWLDVDLKLKDDGHFFSCDKCTGARGHSCDSCSNEWSRNNNFRRCCCICAEYECRDGVPSGTDPGATTVAASRPRFGPDDTVVLFAHGSGDSRYKLRNREVYVVYRELGYHVLVFDYRGYADSSWTNPGQDTMLEDAEAVLAYLEASGASSRRLVGHGHSLGTVVLTHLGAKLTQEGASFRPAGYVLEAPISSIKDVITDGPYALPAAMFINDVDQWLQTEKYAFDNVGSIGAITGEPILILYAEDDDLTTKERVTTLFEAASSSNPRVELVVYPSELGFGHKDIFLAVGLQEMLRTFVEGMGAG